MQPASVKAPTSMPATSRQRRRARKLRDLQRAAAAVTTHHVRRSPTPAPTTVRVAAQLAAPTTAARSAPPTIGLCPTPIKPHSPHQRDGPRSRTHLVPHTPVTPMWQYSSDISRPAVPPCQCPAAPPAQSHPPQPRAGSPTNPAPHTDVRRGSGATLMPLLPQRHDVPSSVLAAQHRTVAPTAGPAALELHFNIS